MNSSNSQKPPDDPNIVLPKSQATEVPEEALTLLVSAKNIYIEGIKIAEIQDLYNQSTAVNCEVDNNVPKLEIPEKTVWGESYSERGRCLGIG